MNFKPEQKEKFRELIKQAASTIQLLESRAGLDQFDSELTSEVIYLDELNSALQSVLLCGFGEGVSSINIPVDSQQQLINEEYME